ncbi:hypothetical protein Fcan01_26870 [Folsomia candida]|uniref:Uncharacterized protein n=1 Tax=Folsomia candida TaxID=158441 RepID=A0A226CZR6_FOLCA|nr:hypothetical protein Fcan01_26870 [Folsomia candida]
MGCTWKYSIIGRGPPTWNRFNLDKFFFEYAKPKFPIILEDFVEIRTTQLDMSSSISRRSDQCKVHVVIVKHSTSPYFPKVYGDDNAKTLVYILPYNRGIPYVISNKYWRRSIDNIRDIFVLNVDYDRMIATALRAFQQRPIQVVEYDPLQEMGQPKGNFKLGYIWVFEPDGTDRNVYHTTRMNPSTLPKLHALSKLIAPRFIVLFELKRYLNFTPLFVLDYELAQKEHKKRGGVILPTIYTPKMFSYGFGLNTRHSNLNPLVTTYLKTREEELYILYCENDPDPYTPSAFSALLFRAFDLATWICLLVTYVGCALTTKLVSRTDEYPFFSVTCIFFRQSVSKFKPLHLIVSLVFIPVLFPYEGDITARVIAPDEPNIYANSKELINSSYTIFVNLINIGNDEYTVLEYDSVHYKIDEANLTSRNTKNLKIVVKRLFKLSKELKKHGERNGFQLFDFAIVKTRQGCIKDRIRRTLYYRKNGLDRKCHFVKDPIVRNEPITWTFKRDRGGGFIRKMTNQMFEHGLTALWYYSYEREALTRPNLKNAAFLDITHEVLKIRKIAFAFVTGIIFIAHNLEVMGVGKIIQDD